MPLVTAVSDALYPLPPRIRFRVGVSGHRPPKLPAAAEVPLRGLLDRILATIAATARGFEKDYAACARAADTVGPSEFVIVSALAEGSDRIVAEAGLATGFALEALLPFGRTEYARDFAAPESRASFERLLGRASSVFELAGAADERARAYEAAGFVMLANVDLLIAVWDGEEAAGIGGTAQIVSRAVAGGIPIVWIDPANPTAMQLSWSRPGELPPANTNARPKETFRPANEAEIARAIKDIVALPQQGAEEQGRGEPTARQSLERYLAERERRWNFCLWYPLLLWVFRVRSWRWTEFHLPSPLADSKAQWDKDLAPLPRDRALRPAIERILLPAFSAADHLAVYYSLVYRSAYIFNFLFAAVAVAVALGGLFARDPESKSYFVVVELAVILAILFTWRRGHRRQWHRRWLEYRRLADSLRQMRVLAPIGSEGSVDRPGRKFDVDEADWVAWYAWTVRRRLPLPDHAVDADYLANIRAVVRAEINGQIDYHSTNTERMAKLDHRLHFYGQIVSSSTLGVGALFLILAGFGFINRTQPHSELILHIFTLFAALLPTLGAALSAIHVQGDFRTVAEQSAQTGKRLAAIDRILAGEPLSYARLADRIEKTSDVMMSDLLEWQTVFRTRPLAPPA